MHPDRGKASPVEKQGWQNNQGVGLLLEMYRFYWNGHWWSVSLTGITRPLANAMTGGKKTGRGRSAKLDWREAELPLFPFSHSADSIISWHSAQDLHINLRYVFVGLSWKFEKFYFLPKLHSDILPKDKFSFRYSTYIYFLGR